MIMYYVGLVFAVVFWVSLVGKLNIEAEDTRDPKKVRHARMAWLSIFLIPVYPVVIILAIPGWIIWNFVRLGRINKEEGK